MRRRHSIIAPMILILIGGVFLIRNFWPAVRVGDLIALYWPYILIVWGAIRLGEIVVWTMQNKPLPPNGVTGGEWVLVVFLCIFGTAFHAVHNRDLRDLFDWFPEMGQRFPYPVERLEKQCGPAPQVTVDSRYGYIHITGADVTMVTVTPHKYIRSFEKTDADRANRSTPVEIVASDNEFTIRTNQDRVRESIATDLDITVPSGASIVVPGIRGNRSIRSDVTVLNVAGSVDVTSDGAAVALRDIGGDVRVELLDNPRVQIDKVNGTVVLKGYAGDLRLHDISGEVTAVDGTFSGELEVRGLRKPLHYQGARVALSLDQLPGEIVYKRGQLTGGNIVGPIDINATSTEVQLIGFTKQLAARLSGGTEHIVLSPGGVVMPSIKVDSDSGNIDLKLPAKASFDLRAETRSGKADNQYGPALRVEEDGRGGTIVGGQSGSPELRLTTGHGQVTVGKAFDSNALNVQTPATPPAPLPPPARPPSRI